jgi:hypothetical protein
MEKEGGMPQVIETACPACGELTLVCKESLRSRPLLWCDTCTWETVGMYTGQGFVVFDMDHENPWFSITPEEGNS